MWVTENYKGKQIWYESELIDIIKLCCKSYLNDGIISQYTEINEFKKGLHLISSEILSIIQKYESEG